MNEANSIISSPRPSHIESSIVHETIKEVLYGSNMIDGIEGHAALSTPAGNSDANWITEQILQQIQSVPSYISSSLVKRPMKEVLCASGMVNNREGQASSSLGDSNPGTKHSSSNNNAKESQ